MATSAAPTFLRPHVHKGYTFVDGGVWANNPIMIGLVDTLACYNVPRDNIRILSIGCGSDPYSVSWLQKTLGGQLCWYDIIFAAMNLQSQNALGQAGLLIGKHNIIRIDPDDEFQGIKMDNYRHASTVLPNHADMKAMQHGRVLKDMFLYAPTDRYSPCNDG
ncbi:MAG: hypothetical protein HYS17_01135 [Micavibrio aeruginosavorus]|uniref:PNPLA domain-containing protein n=1 Tax=Micavibrio aeruginosavorus TaxID=349221 RepID=A0A7T5R2M7_9BACT|nr:MAG: hypothetical protein HYS17_01135 [Micavibrio aeruginosavorus]